VKQLEDFRSIAVHRRSVRKFLQKPVPRRVLEELVEVASWAPSAGNNQDWEFDVVLNSKTIVEMANAARTWWTTRLGREPDSGVAAEMANYAGNFTWFSEVPVLIIVSCKKTEAFLLNILEGRAETAAGRKSSAAMAVQNLQLAASAAGLGSCCLTGPLAAEQELREILGLGRRRDLVCMVAVGYPEETPDPPVRKSVKEILRFHE
jgi:nitroreductase